MLIKKYIIRSLQRRQGQWNILNARHPTFVPVILPKNTDKTIIYLINDTIHSVVHENFFQGNLKCLDLCS